MSAYLMQQMAEMHSADLLHEAERERLIRKAKAARGEHGHVDFVANVLGRLGFRNGLKPALNPGN